MSVLKNQQEDWVIEKGLEAIRSQLNIKETPFFIHWTSATRFTISLNFSIGTNKAFDVHTDSKSAIKAFGTLTPLTDNRTQITLSTTFNYGLLLILCIPLVMLGLEYALNLGIPIPFYLVFPFLFVLALYIFRSEERRLISLFKRHLRL